MSSDGEKVKKLGLVLDPAYTYSLKQGDVWREKEGGEPECVAKVGFERDPDYLYFVDGDGDVARKLRRPRAAQAAAPAQKPVDFATAFAVLRAHVAKKRFVALAKRTPITIFDWSKLGAEQRATFVESHLYELAKKLGKGWDAHLVPVALLGGESHPVPLDELDQQADGVLLLDLRAGGAVVCCNDATSETTRPIASKAADLEIK